MYIVYPDPGKISLHLTIEGAREACLRSGDGSIFHKLRPLRDEEQANTVAFASVSREDDETALFFDYSKAFLYASRRDAVVQNLVIDLET